MVEGEVTNPGNMPALEVRLTWREANTGLRTLPVYYGDNYFSLSPGESREFRIESTAVTKRLALGSRGWNIKPATLR